MNKSKKFEDPQLGLIKVTKRRSSRHIRLSIKNTEFINVSIPTYLPFAAGVKFAKTKSSWIHQQVSKRPSTNIYDGMPIGISHKLKLSLNQNSESVRVQNSVVSIKAKQETANEVPYELAHKGIVRALRVESKYLLQPELDEWCLVTGYKYKKVSFKDMKSRWGSYSSQGNINFSIYLAQMRKDIRSYVIIHELCHSKQMNHSDKFWSLVAKHVPNYKDLRRELKEINPQFIP